MSDSGRTARVPLAAVKVSASVNGHEPGATAPEAPAADQGAAENTLPEKTPAGAGEQPAAPEAVPGQRMNRRARLARLNALQEKPQADETPDDGQASASGQDAARAGQPMAREQDEKSGMVPPVPTRMRAPSDRGAPSGEASVVIPPIPQQGRPRSYGTVISFVLCVLIPAAIIGSYFLVYASNQYVSAFKFVVRDARTAATGTSQGVGLQSFLSAGVTPSPVENYMVADYIASRQAVDTLQAKIDVMGLYSRPDVDWFSRFSAGQPVEKFMNYWQRMVSASFDQVTGIGTAQVRAFTAKDAYEIATLLVSQSEELINAIANRPQQDLIRFAELDLKRAEDRLKEIRLELANLRNTEQVIDPQSNVVASNILLAQTLRTNLSQLQTELSSLSKQKLSKDAPASQILQSRIVATREQLAAVEGQVANDRDGAAPLSRVVGKFERLDLEGKFASNMVQSLMQNLEQVRASALAQHVYVTAFISPALAESSTYPKRILSTFVAALVLFLLWLLGLLIVRSLREHFT